MNPVYARNVWMRISYADRSESRTQRCAVVNGSSSRSTELLYLARRSASDRLAQSYCFSMTLNEWIEFSVSASTDLSLLVHKRRGSISRSKGLE